MEHPFNNFSWRSTDISTAPVVTVTTATLNKMLTWLIWCESLKFVSMWSLFVLMLCYWCGSSKRLKISGEDVHGESLNIENV